ncbi:hypothetical protein RUND412_005044 [Rhizina undulata]
MPPARNCKKPASPTPQNPTEKTGPRRTKHPKASSAIAEPKTGLTKVEQGRCLVKDFSSFSPVDLLKKVKRSQIREKWMSKVRWMLDITFFRVRHMEAASRSTFFQAVVPSIELLDISTVTDWLATEMCDSQESVFVALEALSRISLRKRPVRFQFLAQLVFVTIAALSTRAFISCNSPCWSSIKKKNLPVDFLAYGTETARLLIDPDPSLSGSESDEDEECGGGPGGMFIDGYRVGKIKEVKRYSEALEESTGLGDNPGLDVIAGHLNP